MTEKRIHESRSRIAENIRTVRAEIRLHGTDGESDSAYN
jgi:hypothetical protein